MGGDPPQILSGRRVLIVEDRYMLAAELAAQVERMGGEVLGPAARSEVAMQLAARERVDVAPLDINLDGEMIFPFAVTLAQRGVPLIFLTGYDGGIIPAEWRDRPCLNKPVSFSALEAELAKLLSL